MSEIPPEPGTVQQTGHQSYKCPNCGGAQTLQPGSDSLACGNCGHQVRIDAPAAPPIHEHDFQQARTRLRRGPATDMARDAREVQCKNCGARTVTVQQANRCQFCDEPLVVEIQPQADTVMPDAVLPFAIEKKAATDKFKQWMSSRWFAPGDMSSRAKKDGMDGVYVPYWTYDSYTTTQYTGARGEYYYEDESYTDSQGNSQTRRVRKTRWWPTAGTVEVHFDDVLIPASKGMPRNRLAQLEPWKLNDLKPFDGAFLAGFVAERYSVDLEEGFAEAEKIMEGKIREAVNHHIGGDEQRIHSMSVHHGNVTFKHVLLPVWVSSFKYNSKVYRVVVNARTGEVAGDRPWSVFKIVLFILVIIAAIVGLIVLIKMASGGSKSDGGSQGRLAPAAPARVAQLDAGPGLTHVTPDPGGVWVWRDPA